MPGLNDLAEEFEGRARFVVVEEDGVEVTRLSLNFAPIFIEERLRGMLNSMARREGFEPPTLVSTPPAPFWFTGARTGYGGGVAVPTQRRSPRT